MFFRHLLFRHHRLFAPWAICMLALLALSGCNFPLRETPPPPRVFKLEDVTGRCLKGSAEDIRQYFQGDGDETKIQKIWDCSVKAISNFSKLTEGEKKESYSSHELAVFLETYFLEDIKISDELLVEFMRFKQLFLGGSLDSVTHSELKDLVTLLNRFRNISMSLLPQMKKISLRWKPQNNLVQEQTDLDQMDKDLQSLAADFSTLISRSKQDYDFASFESFSKEIEKAFGGDWKFSVYLEEILPTIRQFKKVFIGGSDKSLQYDEWKPFLVFGIRAYAQYMRYFYFLKNETLSKANLEKSIIEATTLIHDMVAQKPKAKIHYTELYEALDAVAHIWPTLRISEDFSSELMKVKQLLLGGGSDCWTPEDLEMLKSKLPSIFDLIESVEQFITLTTSSTATSTLGQQPTTDQVQAAIKKLSVAFSGIVTNPIRFSSLIRLIQETQKMYGNSLTEKNKLILSNFEKLMPLVSELKGLFVGGDPDLLNPSEFKDFFEVLNKMYTKFFELKNQTTPSTTLDIFSFFADMIGDKKISKDQLKKVAKELMNSPLSQESFSALSPTDISTLTSDSNDTLDQAFELKTLLVGGDPSNIQGSEFKSALAKWMAIRKIVIQIKPIEDVLFLKWNSKPLSLKDKLTRLNEVDQKLTQIFDQLKTIFVEDFELKDLETLIPKIQNMLKPSLGSDPTTSKFLSEWKNDSEFAKMGQFLKAELVGGQGQIIRSTEWNSFLNLLRQGVGIYIRYHYLLKETSLLRDEGPQSLVSFTSYTGSELKSWLPFSFEKWTGIWVAFENVGYIPKNVNGIDFKKVFEWALTRPLLSPEERLNAHSSAEDLLAQKGQIEFRHLERLNTEISAWAEVQDLLNRTLPPAAVSISASDFYKRWKANINILTATSALSSGVNISSSVKQMDSLFTTGLPLLVTDKGTLQIGQKPGEQIYLLNALDELNLKRIAIHLVIRSYSTDLARANDGLGITLPEFTDIVEDLNKFLPSIAIEQNVKKFATARFREANLFTSHSNGNDLIELGEGVEFLSLLLSGKKISEAMHGPLDTKCGIIHLVEHPSSSTMASKSGVDKTCLIHFLQDQYKNYFGSLPFMVEYLNRLSRSESKEFFESLLKAVGHNSSHTSDHTSDDTSNYTSDKSVTLTHVEQIPFVIQFIENIFAIYDGNRSGNLGVRESLKAYPLFKKLLKDLSGLGSDEELQAVFTYLLNNSTPPSQGVEGAIRFYWWKINRRSWVLDVDRAKLAETLAVIAEATSKKK